MLYPQHVLIQTHLDQAQESILVQAFSFTDPDIAASLIHAKKRGVNVRVLLDKSNIKDAHSKRPLMIKEGIPVAIDSCIGIAHNKVMILDGKILITGSYNFSKNAYSRNAENVLVIHNPDMASLYTKNFQKRWNMGHEGSPPRTS